MKTEIEELTNDLKQRFDKGEAESLKWLFQPLIQLLTRGKPVAIDEIAAATKRSSKEIENILSTLPSVERDEQGRVIGYGITLNPTPHHFEVGGKTLYTWCALDTLMFPKLIGRTVHIESPCYKTRKTIKVTVNPNQVVSVEPPSAVVSIVTPEQMTSVRESFCNQVHFFSFT